MPIRRVTQGARARVRGEQQVARSNPTSEPTLSQRDGYRTYSLVFPGDLASSQVVQWVHAVSGTLRIGGWLFGSRRALVFELWSAGRAITYRLRVPSAHARYVVDQLRTLIPGIRVSPEEAMPQPTWTRVVELGTRRLEHTLLVADPEALAASVLASVQVGRSQTALLQWVVIPALPERPPEQRQAVRQRGRGYLVVGDLTSPGRDRIADRREKLSEPNVLGVLRVAVRAGSAESADQLLLSIRAALMSVRTADNSFYRRFVPRAMLQRRVAAGHVPRLFHAQLSATEFAALTGWPMGRPHVAGLPQARTRHLPASAAIPHGPLVVARSNFPGDERPLALNAHTACTHLHLVGPTETGKTTLAANLCSQIMRLGAPLIVMESKGDLFRAVLDAVPDGRVDDVIIFDVAGGARRPIGYNVLAEGSSARVVVEDLCLLFEHLYPDMRRGVWARAALHRGLSTLITRPDSTFVDLVPLLSGVERSDTETAWRDELVAEVRDPELERFWERFEALSPAQQETRVAPVLDRVWQLNERPEIRHIIGQSRSSFTMRDVMRQQKVLLVNLAGLGATTAGLVGTLLLNNVWTAAQAGAARGSLPTCLVLDEFQDFANLPVEPEELFAKARSYGLAITAAHQHLGQLPPDLRSAVLANARSKIVFQTTADDARVFTREFGHQVTDEDFLNLGRFEVLAKLAGEDGVSNPVTAETYPPAEPTGNAARVVHRSRMRSGQPVADVESEIQQRRAPRGGPRQKPRIGGQKWG